MSSFRMVGVDPGFAHFAFCALDLYAVGGSDIVNTSLVITKVSKKKIDKIADDIDRLQAIEDAWKTFLEKNQPAVAVFEEPGKCLMRRNGKWATNPTLLRTSCLAWGALHGVCRDRGIYVISVGSQEIKRALTGRNNASKEEIISAVKGRYPGYSGWPQTKNIEHVADAVAAAVTGIQDPAVMVMIQQLRTRP